jgi:Aspartyl/Asparaginyl beta-hydroxylase
MQHLQVNFVPYIDKYQGASVNINKIIFDYEVIKDKLADVTNHENQVLVQKKFHILKDGVFDKAIDNVPYTQGIIDYLQKRINFNSVTYRSIQPNTAYNWHNGTGGLCHHIPIITNPGCWFVYENRSFSMPADGTIYVVNSSRNHTFVNSGTKPRIHLTFEIL